MAKLCRHRQRMMHGIIHRVRDDDLFAGMRVTVDNDWAFQIHRRAHVTVDGHDAEQQRATERGRGGPGA